MGTERVRLERVISLGGVERGGRTARIFGVVRGQTPSSVFRRPYGVAWDGEDLLVSDPDGGRVARIGPRGELRLAAAGGVAYPIGIASCEQGIAVSDSSSGRIALLDPDLKFRRWLAEGMTRPTGLACDGDRLYVAETGLHRVVVLEGDGRRWSIGGRGGKPGEFNFPVAVTLDGSYLWVGDALNFRLQRFSVDRGEFVGAFGGIGDAPGEIPRGKGLTVDSQGHVWVTDAHLNVVAIYERDGTFLMSIGRQGSGEGEFDFPAGVAARGDGRVAVVDSLNRRVQVFRILEVGQARQ